MGDFCTLANKFKAQTGTPMLYELYAICEHQGSQMQDGHYVAYVNSGPSLAREEWFGLSDTKVWKCERAEVLKVEAYIAFYRRIDTLVSEDQGESAMASGEAPAPDQAAAVDGT